MALSGAGKGVVSNVEPPNVTSPLMCVPVRVGVELGDREGVGGLPRVGLQIFRVLDEHLAIGPAVDPHHLGLRPAGDEHDENGKQYRDEGAARRATTLKRSITTGPRSPVEPIARTRSAWWPTATQ